MALERYPSTYSWPHLSYSGPTSSADSFTVSFMDRANSPCILESEYLLNNVFYESDFPVYLRE